MSNPEFGNLNDKQVPIWLGQQRYPQSPLYNMGMLFHITGELDLDRLERAFASVVKQYDLMRCVLREENASANQLVMENLTYRFEVVDFSDSLQPYEDCKHYFEQRNCQQLDLASRNFDTAVALLGKTEIVWYLSQHHLFTDIASLEIIFHKVSDRYQEIDREDRSQTVAPVVFSAAKNSHGSVYLTQVSSTS